MQPSISVVIPTYRRPDLLQRCLQALCRQTIPAAWLEIIVVDDGNDPETAQVVKRMQQSWWGQLRYLGQPERRGPAAARNRGWQAATGRIIAFTDDDCLPGPGWLAAGMAAFRKGAKALTGRVVMPLPDKPTAHDRTAALLETAEFVTANCFCLKEVLMQVGGFCEEFAIAWREDSDLQFTLLASAVPITPCPDAVVVHPLRPGSWHAPLRDERKNRYDALLYKRHPALFRQRIPQYRPLVLTYYAAVVCCLAGLTGLVAGNSVMASAGLTGWGAITAVLFLRRLSGAGRSVKTSTECFLTALATPFLSVFWRLYGAVQYRVLYW